MLVRIGIEIVEGNTCTDLLYRLLDKYGLNWQNPNPNSGRLIK